MNLKVLSVVAIGATLLAGCNNAAAPATSTKTLTAVKVDAASLDGAAAYWANAPKLEVSTKVPDKKAAEGAKVTLQAVYDGKNIVVRAEWADTTESILRNTWTYSGTGFTRGGDEDRLALIFPMSNDAAFASKGCAVACHNSDADENKWWMGSDSADVKYDVWHWKAGESGLANQTDDQVFGAKAFITSTTGRANDVGTGGPVNNTVGSPAAPKFMSSKGTTAKFMMSGEEIPLDVTKLKAGDKVPGYVIAPWAGSRGDVSSKATWANGKWVLVMSRALSTGNPDDLAFQPPKNVPFGVAVFDNAGDLEHAVGGEVLTLSWK